MPLTYKANTHFFQRVDDMGVALKIHCAKYQLDFISYKLCIEQQWISHM